MKITPRIRKFQEGGPMGPEAAPEQGGMPEGAPQGGGDPLMQIAQIFAEGLQNQDCEALAQGAQMFLELVQQAQGGAPGGAQGGEPAPEGQPVFRRGGRLAYRMRFR